MKVRTKKVIDCFDLDELVVKTYGRPYCFQQQEDCRNRGVYSINVPTKYPVDFDNDTIPEIVNHNDKGVSFKAWLERDPKKPMADDRTDYSLELWWHRNFYPDITMVMNDLHAKGLIEAGSYLINIDW